MKTVLITGGRGFLGTALAKRLSDEGRTVRILTRSRKEDGASMSAGGQVIHGDIRDLSAVDRSMEGVDTVIHLVSNFRRGGSDKKEAYGINVEGTEHLLDSSMRHGVTRFIHCSTIGVHGNVKQIPADEKTPFNPGDLYQETKLLAEKKVWDFYRKTGLPTVVIRPISMYGPGDLRMLKLFKMIKKGRFVMVGSGKVFFQPAYIDDVVEGFILSMGNERAVGEAFIIGSDEYIPLEELVGLIARQLNVSPPRLKIPLAPVLWMATLCEFLCVPLGIEPPLHRRRVSFFQNNRAFNIDKAKRILGFKPKVSLIEGLRRTISWYEQHGWI